MAGAVADDRKTWMPPPQPDVLDHLHGRGNVLVAFALVFPDQPQVLAALLAAFLRFRPIVHDPLPEQVARQRLANSGLLGRRPLRPGIASGTRRRVLGQPLFLAEPLDRNTAAPLRRDSFGPLLCLRIGRLRLRYSVAHDTGVQCLPVRQEARFTRRLLCSSCRITRVTPRTGVASHSPRNRKRFPRFRRRPMGRLARYPRTDGWSGWKN